MIYLFSKCSLNSAECQELFWAIMMLRLMDKADETWLCELTSQPVCAWSFSASWGDDASLSKVDGVCVGFTGHHHEAPPSGWLHSENGSPPSLEAAGPHSRWHSGFLLSLWLRVCSRPLSLADRWLSSQCLFIWFFSLCMCPTTPFYFW